MQTYEHRQFSPWPLATLALITVVESARAAKRGKASHKTIPTLGFALFAMQFSVLATRVDDEGVSWSFGLGFPSGVIRFDEIAEVERTKTSFLEGFGIHWTPRHGWLWNAAGRDAVIVRKRSGRNITLGIDDAAGLYDAIRARLTPRG